MILIQISFLMRPVAVGSRNRKNCLRMFFHLLEWWGTTKPEFTLFRSKILKIYRPCMTVHLNHRPLGEPHAPDAVLSYHMSPDNARAFAPGRMLKFITEICLKPRFGDEIRQFVSKLRVFRLILRRVCRRIDGKSTISAKISGELFCAVYRSE